MAYQHSTFRNFLTGNGVTTSAVSAFEYAVSFEKGADADVALAIMCSLTTSTADTASTKKMECFQKVMNTSTS